MLLGKVAAPTSHFGLEPDRRLPAANYGILSCACGLWTANVTGPHLGTGAERAVPHLWPAPEAARPPAAAALHWAAPKAASYCQSSALPAAWRTICWSHPHPALHQLVAEATLQTSPVRAPLPHLSRFSVLRLQRLLPAEPAILHDMQASHGLLQP